MNVNFWKEVTNEELRQKFCDLENKLFEQKLGAYALNAFKRRDIDSFKLLCNKNQTMINVFEQIIDLNITYLSKMYNSKNEYAKKTVIENAMSILKNWKNTLKSDTQIPTTQPTYTKPTNINWYEKENEVTF